jgi:GNAT superfamily N-acetyltransferase
VGQDGRVPAARRLRPSEAAVALRTVVAAFRRDPLLRWWFADDETYDELAGRFFGVLLETRLEGGEVWVVDAGDDIAAVSMWVPPGGNLLGPEVAAERYAQVVAGLPASSGERVAATDEVVDALLPTEPHWYLGVLATHPDHRGAGLGSVVCAPVFDAADRAGLPIVLETANPANVGYYTRRGFAMLHQAAIVPDGAQTAVDGADGTDANATGPLTMCIMLRAPATV